MLEYGLIHALPPSDRRVFNRAEAASFTGISRGKFDQLVASGHLPAALPFPGIKRWDRSALEKALDQMSGISGGQSQAATPLKQWMEQRANRSA